MHKTTLGRLNEQIRQLGDLTASQETQAMLCRALAKQIDLASGSNVGVHSMALGPLVKQLEQSIEKLLVSKPAGDDLLDFIFNEPEEQFGGIGARDWQAKRKAETVARNVIGTAKTATAVKQKVTAIGTCKSCWSKYFPDTEPDEVTEGGIHATYVHADECADRFLFEEFQLMQEEPSSEEFTGAGWFCPHIDLSDDDNSEG
jgi:hypothetical protein